ncbi:unnamed protein product [Aphanomyces euteiches]
MPHPSRTAWDESLGPLGEYMMCESRAFENENSRLRAAYDDLCLKYTSVLTENLNLGDHFNQQRIRLESRINVQRWEYNQLEKKLTAVNRRLQHALRLLSHSNNQNKRFQAVAKRNGVLLKLQAFPDTVFQRLQRTEETSEESEEDNKSTEEE